MLNPKSVVKRLAIVFGIVMLGSVCSYALPTANAAHQDTLVLWVMDDGANSTNTLKTVTGNFTKETGVPVYVQFLNWGDAYDKMRLTLALNPANHADIEIPDVVQLGSSWVSFFAHNGLIDPIDSALSQSVDVSRFLPESMKDSRIGKGTQSYSFPWFLDVRGFFVNAKVWNEFGLKENDIDTFSKFHEVIRKIGQARIKNNAGALVSPFEFGIKSDWTAHQQMAPILWSFGGDFVKESGDSYCSALADSATLFGVNQYLNFFWELELFPYALQDNSIQGTNRFVNSEIAIYYGTSELMRKLELDGKVGGLKDSPLASDGIAVVATPQGVGPAVTFVGGSHLALPKYGDPRRKKLAQSLISYLLRSDVMDFYSSHIGFLPADKNVMQKWTKDPRYSRLIEGLEKNGRSFLNIPEWTQVEGAVNAMVGNIGYYRVQHPTESPESAASFVLYAHEKINEILGCKETSNRTELLRKIQLELSKRVVEKPEEIQKGVGISLRYRLIAASVICIIILIVSVIKYYRKR